MSQLATVAALPVSSSSSPPATVIDEYIARTFARYEHVLVVQLPRLAEPQVIELGRAMRHVGYLVETLVGFAVGSAFGVVARALRRYCNRDVRTALDELLAKTKQNHLVAVPDTRGATGFFDREKPLVDELGSQLQARLCYAAADARRQIVAVHQMIARVAPDQLSHFLTAMTELVNDDSAAVDFGEQLGHGWLNTIAAATRKPAPAISGTPRTRQLWRTWFAGVTGAPVLAELTQEQVVAAGFVMRIA